MDFIQPPDLPTNSSIRWETVLPPMIPRMNRAFGKYSLTPELLIPGTDHASAASAQVNCDHSGFTVEVNVTDFNPEDLMVKVTGDFLEVQGKHEKKKTDGPGMVTRQFNRRYRIPEGVDTLALVSAVSPDGILFISAPLLQDKDIKPHTQS